MILQVGERRGASAVQHGNHMPGEVAGPCEIGSDTAVAVDLAGTNNFAGHMVAMLHGAGASSLTDLQNHAAIKLS